MPTVITQAKSIKNKIYINYYNGFPLPLYNVFIQNCYKTSLNCAYYHSWPLGKTKSVPITYRLMKSEKSS